MRTIALLVRTALIGGAVLAAGIALMLLLADGARAQESCLYEGKTYPEGAVTCQGGLRQTCVNGVWQNNEGRRCDDGDGDDIGDADED